ncbi:MAG: helix-turn-helix transcriptional regulator [Bellilinea sp.]
MDSPTRDKILELLQHTPNLTAAEMSRSLRVTRADIRYHLKLLVSQGLIVQMPAIPRTSSLSPGRPAMTYQLSQSGRPDMLPTLSSVLLDMGKSSASSIPFLEQLASRLIPVDAESSLQTSLPQRLNTAIQIINQHPYQARWEAHRAGPQVILSNCPFSAIIDGHPELCKVDRQILENTTGLRAIQTRKIDFTQPTSASCIFILMKHETEENKKPLQ